MYIILVDYPTPIIIIPSVVAATFFDDVVNTQVFQARVLRKKLTVASLAYARGARDYDIWLAPGHSACSVRLLWDAPGISPR